MSILGMNNPTEYQYRTGPVPKRYRPQGLGTWFWSQKNIWYPRFSTVYCDEQPNGIPIPNWYWPKGLSTVLGTRFWSQKIFGTPAWVWDGCTVLIPSLYHIISEVAKWACLVTCQKGFGFKQVFLSTGHNGFGRIRLIWKHFLSFLKFFITNMC